MLNTMQELEEQKAKSYGVLPVSKEILLDELMTMQADSEYQSRQGARIFEKFKLSDRGLSFSDLGATRLAETKEISNQPNPIVEKISMPRYEQKIFSIPTLDKGMSGIASKKQTIGKGKKKQIQEILFFSLPKTRGSLVASKQRARTHVLENIAKKSESDGKTFFGTMGKPQSSTHFPNRFKRVYETTLNLQNGAFFALDLIAGQTALENLVNHGKIVNLKLHNLANVLMAQFPVTPKKLSTKNKERMNQGEILRKIFLAKVTKKKSLKGQENALRKFANDEPITPKAKTRNRGSVEVFVKHNNVELSFLVKRQKTNHVSYWKHIDALGINGLTLAMFRKTSKESLATNENRVIVMGKYELTFKPNHN